MGPRALARSVALTIPPVRHLYDSLLTSYEEAVVLRKQLAAANSERAAVSARATKANAELVASKEQNAKLRDDIRNAGEEARALAEKLYSSEEQVRSSEEKLRSSEEQVRSSEEKRRHEMPINYSFRKLQIIITSRCDFTCVMCNIIHEGKAVLKEHTVRTLIEDADQLDFDEIEISGGEPYYLPYFKSVIEEYAGNIKPKLKICTNAYSLDRALIDKLAGRQKLHFQVSFDGIGDIHNAIRVQGRYDAFTKSERNFRALAEAGLTVSLNTVIQRHNVGNILQTYRHFKDVDYLFHGFGIVEEGSWDYDKNRILPEQTAALANELETLVAEAKADGKEVGIDENMIDHLRHMKSDGAAQQTSEFALHAGYGCPFPSRL